MKHARAEDEDGNDDLAGFGYRRRTTHPRSELFAAHIQSLNAQFIDHATRRVREDPCAFLIGAARDYVRYAKEIREEFQDVLGEEAREEAVARRTSDARRRRPSSGRGR